MSALAESRPEAPREVSLDLVRRDREVRGLVDQANRAMALAGYTEHGRRHAGISGNRARDLLLELGYHARTAELAAIGAYLHDVGNAINRHSHPTAGATLVYPILVRLGMGQEEALEVCGAIGTHEDDVDDPVSPVTAAVMIADKSDVHRSRVHNPNRSTFDIHDRVNYATTASHLRTEPEPRIVTLDLQIDTSFASVVEYFEIFLGRMVMCRRAAELLDATFSLSINGQRLL
jgi:metal-dependent HD superfamily phosphatase/phosphodiesterase